MKKLLFGIVFTLFLCSPVDAKYQHQCPDFYETANYRTYYCILELEPFSKIVINFPPVSTIPFISIRGAYDSGYEYESVYILDCVSTQNIVMNDNKVKVVAYNKCPIEKYAVINLTVTR